MLVSCPTCPAEYEIAESDLGPEGRVVECSACGARWLQPALAAAAPSADSTIPGLAEAKRSLEGMTDEDAPGLRRESLYGDDDDDAAEVAPPPAPATATATAPTPIRPGPDLSPARPIEDVAVDPDEAPRRSARRGGDLPDAARLNAELRASAHEEERVERRRRSSFRTGLVLVLIIGGIGAGVYHGRDKIVELAPQAAGPLDGYVAAVDDGKAQAMVWIDMAMAKIKPMIGQEAPAPQADPAPQAATPDATTPDATTPATPTTATPAAAKPAAATPAMPDSDAAPASGTTDPAPTPMMPPSMPAMTAPGAPSQMPAMPSAN